MYRLGVLRGHLKTNIQMLLITTDDTRSLVCGRFMTQVIFTYKLKYKKIINNT